MLNQVVLIGRYRGSDSVNNCIFLNIGSKDEPRNIPIYLTDSIYHNVLDYVDDDAVIGVKGKLEVDFVDTIKIIGEKVSFLSSGRRDNE